MQDCLASHILQYPQNHSNISLDYRSGGENLCGQLLSSSYLLTVTNGHSLVIQTHSPLLLIMYEFLVSVSMSDSQQVPMPAL